jgi:hypothetical protein
MACKQKTAASLFLGAVFVIRGDIKLLAFLLHNPEHGCRRFEHPFGVRDRIKGFMV